MTNEDLKRRDAIIQDTFSDVQEWYDREELAVSEMADKIRYQGEFSPIYSAMVADAILRDDNYTAEQKRMTLATFIEALAENAL